MSAAEILLELQSLGSEQTRKTYRRHGVGDNQYGVSYANMGKLKKRLKLNHDLAVELWASGNHDARVLATMIADPTRMTGATLEAWVKDLDSSPIAGAFADLAAQAPTAKAKAEKWIKARVEWTAAAGWTVLSRLAADATLPDEYFAAHLETIERDIPTAKNRVRYCMNGTVIAIGCRNEALREKALEAAARIGKVEVDHGDTSCKTPDAAEYIRKVVAHRQK